jgi:hypothetical protein
VSGRDCLDEKFESDAGWNERNMTINSILSSIQQLFWGHVNGLLMSLLLLNILGGRAVVIADSNLPSGERGVDGRLIRVAWHSIDSLSARSLTGEFDGAVSNLLASFRVSRFKGKLKRFFFAMLEISNDCDSVDVKFTRSKASN